MYNSRGQREGTNLEANKTIGGGGGQFVIKSPYGF